MSAFGGKGAGKASARPELENSQDWLKPAEALGKAKTDYL
jgi:hypothetical protein